MKSKVIIVGKLKEDPEIRFTKEEVPVAKFWVIVDGDKEPSQYTCIAMKGLATVVGEHLKKGSLVAIEGELKVQSYDSPAVGYKPAKSVQVYIENLLMLDKKFYKEATEAEKCQ